MATIIFAPDQLSSLTLGPFGLSRQYALMPIHDYPGILCQMLTGIRSWSPVAAIFALVVKIVQELTYRPDC